MDILCTKKVFEVGEEKIEAKKCSILVLFEVWQIISDIIKRNWKKDIIDVIGSLQEKDKSKFLIDALKTQQPSQDQINEYMMTIDGVITVLSLVLKKDIATIKALIQKDAEKMYEIYAYILDITEKKDTEEAEEVEEDKKK